MTSDPASISTLISDASCSMDSAGFSTALSSVFSSTMDSGSFWLSCEIPASSSISSIFLRMISVRKSLFVYLPSCFSLSISRHLWYLLKKLSGTEIARVRVTSLLSCFLLISSSCLIKCSSITFSRKSDTFIPVRSSSSHIL